jgi:hypothetical protein
MWTQPFAQPAHSPLIEYMYIVDLEQGSLSVMNDHLQLTYLFNEFDIALELFKVDKEERSGTLVRYISQDADVPDMCGPTVQARLKFI